MSKKIATWPVTCSLGWRVLALALIASSVLPPVVADNAPQLNAPPTDPYLEAKHVAREFLFAEDSGDAEAYQRWIVPQADSDLLLRKERPNAEESKILRRQVDAIVFERPLPMTHIGTFVAVGDAAPPPGAKTGFAARYRGHYLAIPMLNTSMGWKVDIRYWLVQSRMARAGGREDEPELVARKFLAAELGKRPEALANLVVGTVDAEHLTTEVDWEPDDLAFALQSVDVMPIAHARPEERFRLPTGDVVTEKTAPDRMILVGLFGQLELPFVMDQLDGHWKIEPQDYFAMIQHMSGY